MSLQLTLYPQYYQGSNPLNATATELLVDGNIFQLINGSSNTLNVTGSLPQAYINANPLSVNTWYRFTSSASGGFSSSGGVLVGALENYLVQKLSNLTIGALYELKVTFTVNPTGLKIHQFNNTVLIATQTLTGTGTQTMTFTASSNSDTIVFENLSAALFVSSMSVQLSPQSPTGVMTDLSNGQVILDLYEDEDIPLTLSVDDFKNVAEKVQSYSKAFNVPATKRNNKIFDNIFEVTRTQTGIEFNPYVKSQCELKDDGLILFEGYLRLIDITDKNGEISYNVNLYSEAVALADVLKEKKFRDLDFSELSHQYNKTSIKNSWSDSTGLPLITPLLTSSFAYDSALGVNNTNVLKYPFVDWTHQILISNGQYGTANFPQLPLLESVFRPFIQVKYIIDRIFADTPFTFTSDFFNTSDFKKLFVDFNWGGSELPSVTGGNGWAGYWAKVGITTNPSVDAGTSFTNLQLYDLTIGSLPITSLPPNYNDSTHKITATTDGETYSINGNWEIENTSGSSIDVECRWVKNEGTATETVITTQTLTIAGGSYSDWVFTVPQETLASGNTLEAQFKRLSGSSGDIRQRENGTSYTSTVGFVVSFTVVATDTILQTLRGDLGQFEFLKGIMTMFNLVTIPDKQNPNNLLIEPYADVFIKNTNGTSLADRSIKHDWTTKIDVEQIKMTPLTELNKKTIFKFVEDESDYTFKLYKNSTQSPSSESGHLYGSLIYDASAFTILEGEEEIIAEPFAATVPKPLFDQFADFVVPAIFTSNDEQTQFEGFDNTIRIMYNNGVKTLQNGVTYYIPAQNGVVGSAAENEFLQFSHLTDIPTLTSTTLGTATSQDYHFGQCQYFNGIGNAPVENLFTLYWLPYFSELYNSDTRTMTLKVNLNASDIANFNFADTVFIKNRTFRVNKIDYKPNDLSTVEFILIT